MSKRKISDYSVSPTEHYKIVLLGDGCIGKSTLFDKLNKLHDEDYRFPKKYKATDNFNFNRINLNTNNGLISIDLWDTAGQENRGGKLRDAYLKGADAILLLYDVSEKETKTNISKWLKQSKRVSPNVPIAVLGNKSDLFDNLQQSKVVKIRECNLQRDYGFNKVKNFLVSIKEDTHIEFEKAYWSGNITVKEKSGCLVGLEYVLGELLRKNVEIAY